MLTPRAQRTRASLVAAARQVFERDGFLNARITDIAEAAGVAHGSFYTYFTSKEEIFRAVIHELQEALIQERAADGPAPSGEPIWNAVHRANRRYLATWRSHTDLMKLWEEVAILDSNVAAMLAESRKAFIARSEQSIRNLQERGFVSPALDPHIAAFALTGMVSRFAYVWFTTGEDFDFDTVAEQLTRLWLSALGTDPAATR